MTVWERVRDKTTGHHFDLPLDAAQLLITRGAVDLHPSHGRHSGRPCSPKHRVPMGTPAPKKAAKPKAETVADQPKESESP